MGEARFVLECYYEKEISTLTWDQETARLTVRFAATPEFGQIQAEKREIALLTRLAFEHI